MNTTTSMVARILAKTLTTGQAASVIDALLCCDDHPALDDLETQVGQALFDSLCDRCPDSVRIAMRGEAA